MHVVEINERVLYPEDGLILGNGDISVSIYQTADCLIWRFGKGDVWDRRLDLSMDPVPAHIDEVIRGIEVEGWKCGPYGGPVEAVNGTENPGRMREICQGTPPSYKDRPYPCPKPLGELALHLPPDQLGLKIVQRLIIEEAKILITCQWKSGVRLNVESFIHPLHNILIVDWHVENWTPETETGLDLPPVWFSLYRWADPDIREFDEKLLGSSRYSLLPNSVNVPLAPLPRPTVKKEGSLIFIHQSFPPDTTFKDGFSYGMAPFTQKAGMEAVDMAKTGEARIQIMPEVNSKAGWMVVGISSGSDKCGTTEQLHNFHKMLAVNPLEVLANWKEEVRIKAQEFWSRSSLSVSEPLIENLWYETLHVRRCTTLGGKIPPGLFLPSTVQDYSIWHGDYHTNYNFQQPFWGDLTANHTEIFDAFFTGMEFFLQIGRKIARDYYNCRGVFIQLSGYPLYAEDDPLGVVPMGRMAYMTGWVANHYWWRFKYTMDIQWLRTVGYPVLKECALFYTDFLKKGKDGLYHAFPSNHGEDGFSGSSRDFTDRSQVMQHARYALRIAIKASEVLEVDQDLRAQWRDRLDNCAGDDGMPRIELTGLEKECYEKNPPEFGFGSPYQPHMENRRQKPCAPNDSPVFSDFEEELKELNNAHFPYDLHKWYFGKYPYFLMQKLRSGNFSASRDFPLFLKMIEKWRHPNGLLCAMSIANYGHMGAWTESLGILAPLQEMMLQSWDGALRIFPAWPEELDAEFKNFRAEGAFLVSAKWRNGEVSEIEIFSEKGSFCCLYNPWDTDIVVMDEHGSYVDIEYDAYGRSGFRTVAGRNYRVLKDNGCRKHDSTSN